MLVEARNEMDIERSKAARLARDVEELRAKSDEEASAAGIALETERKARQALEAQARVAFFFFHPSVV